MFHFSKRTKDVNNDIRDALFGDKPITKWCNGSGLPWDLFIGAKDEINLGNKQKAIEILNKVINIKDLESRHYLQAWHFLKQLGVIPDKNIANKVYGIILEVSLNGGLDILAAYEDHSARYFNYSGSVVIWDKADTSLNHLIDNLISISQGVVAQIGPWDKERPNPPIKGNARMNFLTPIGLYFGEGPLNLLSKDPIDGSIITAGTELMQKLIQKSNVSGKDHTK
ncbi:MAG TPA: hypothetical protein VIK78_02000 [Ruminiclostridium sp.]